MATEPRKIKPEELWGVWDNDYDEWCRTDHQRIIVGPESEMVEFATKDIDDYCNFTPSPIVDLSEYRKVGE